MKSPTSVHPRPSRSASISTTAPALVAVLASLLLGAAERAQAQASVPASSYSSNVPRLEPGCDTGELEGQYVVCCWDENGALECTGIV
ncbi:hypothetical protein [Streptomyces sp. NPDC059378]|uniref:hypothetical protein n=1 Tax=Streptomyces sp. NPDC059378 TaxID=3346815 RepID=UPI003696DEB0